MKSTQSVRDYRARMKADGFTRIEVYVHPEDHGRIRDLARWLRIDRKRKGASNGKS